jgi:hypothetical protein
MVPNLVLFFSLIVFPPVLVLFLVLGAVSASYAPDAEWVKKVPG